MQNTKVSSNKETRILWNAPNTWLVISRKANIIEIINEKCNSDSFAITDISHSRAVIQIKGPGTKEVLKKGCPLNFHEFEKNNCARYRFSWNYYCRLISLIIIQIRLTFLL